eukprot:jgi/Tetstr1/437592/TSEL_026263.t1
MAVEGVAVKVSTTDGVGRLPSEMLALCEVTFRDREAPGSYELGQRTLDLPSSSLTSHTLKSYADKLFHIVEFCHDSENITPREASATVV